MKRAIKIIIIGLLQTIILFGVNNVAYAESSYPIAGTQPDRRPVGAPFFQDYKKDKDWYARALTGLEQPYPFSFRFLEDQGNWYTPFTRPGMLDRYDVRQWHRSKK